MGAGKYSHKREFFVALVFCVQNVKNYLYFFHSGAIINLYTGEKSFRFSTSINKMLIFWQFGWLGLCENTKF